MPLAAILPPAGAPTGLMGTAATAGGPVLTGAPPRPDRTAGQAGRPGRVASGPSRVRGRQASVMPLRTRPPADSRTAAATAPATSAWNTLGMM